MFSVEPLLYPSVFQQYYNAWQIDGHRVTKAHIILACNAKQDQTTVQSNHYLSI